MEVRILPGPSGGSWLAGAENRQSGGSRAGARVRSSGEPRDPYRRAAGSLPGRQRLAGKATTTVPLQGCGRVSQQRLLLRPCGTTRPTGTGTNAEAHPLSEAAAADGSVRTWLVDLVDGVERLLGGKTLTRVRGQLLDQVIPRHGL